MNSLSSERTHTHRNAMQHVVKNAPRELPENVEEGLLEVVVGLGRDVVVLQVLAAVEVDVLRLHLQSGRAVSDVGTCSIHTAHTHAIRGQQRELQTRSALALRSLQSTLLPHSTIGMFSHTRTRSLCQWGTFLYVTRAVTSNMMMAALPPM